MSDATERLVNLAMYLAAATEPVTAERVRADVAGYPDDQDEAAFLRMFERDKDDLRAAGLTIDVDTDGRYRMDSSASFAAKVSLSAEEFAALRATAAALLEDPSFPFSGDLRFALAKVENTLDVPEVHASAAIADECPDLQGDSVARIASALGSAKRVEFAYTNSRGETAAHEVEPYGMFAREGRWYMVGRDTALDQVRTYALSRVSDLTVNASRPKTPDYERPDDFDVSAYIRLPFQFGPETFEAVVRIRHDIAWRAPALTAGKGVLAEDPDGTLTWTVTARDRERLMQWVVENGPGITVVEPQDLARALHEGLARVAARHG